MKGNRKLIGAFVFMAAGVALAGFDKFNDIIANYLLLVYSAFAVGNSAERYSEALITKFKNEKGL